MKTLVADGRARSIGVCNFTPAQLDDLISHTGFTPAINQVELHPFHSQNIVREANAQHGIITQAWSPLGGVFINHPADPDNIQRPVDAPTIVEIAERHCRTPAQVILRWHLQRDTAVIPKSVNPERIRENLDVFGFTLPEEDVAAITALNTDWRGGPNPDTYPDQR